ncbi:hypothetical protein [Rugosimonospora acidiphila]
MDSTRIKAPISRWGAVNLVASRGSPAGALGGTGEGLGGAGGVLGGYGD